jgi:hypothetical protein
MSAPLVPSPLDYIGRRHLAFYPEIRRAGPNEWMMGAGSWSEVQFVNAETGNEIWVSRAYIGAVSEGADCLVVGLTQDLELRRGRVEPRGRRVIEMPPPEDKVRERRGPAAVVGIRLERASPSAFQRTSVRVGVCVLFVAGLFALIAAASRIY